MSKTIKTKDNKVMAYISPGPFIMGSNECGMESPMRIVELPAFYIDIYPVTNQEYSAFVKDTGYHHIPQDWIDGKYPEECWDHPVRVTWHDAQAYAQWAGKRLPTEAEWEKAARGTDGRRWPWGNEFLESYAATWESSLFNGTQTTSVTAHPEGVSPYGVYEMAGNIEEWVEDWLQAYEGSSYHCYAYGTRYKVLRGGSWLFTQDHGCCTYRCYEMPHGDFPLEGPGDAPQGDRKPWSTDVGGPGFRCAMDSAEGEAR